MLTIKNSPWKHRLVRYAYLLWALTLLASSAAKAVSVDASASALAWVSIEWRLRVQCVYALSIVECLVGMAMLQQCRSNLAAWCGFGIATTGLGAHLGGVIVGSGRECGCFGALAVPESAIMVACGAGVFGCIGHIALKFPAPPYSAFLVWLGRGAALTVLLLCCVDALSETKSFVLDSIRSNDAIVIVGDVGCAACEAVVDGIEPLLEPETDRWMLVRSGSPRDGTLSRWKLLELPSDVWWRLRDGQQTVAFVVTRVGAERMPPDLQTAAQIVEWIGVRRRGRPASR